MKNKLLPAALLMIALAAVMPPAQAKWVWTPETGWFRVESVPREAPEEGLEKAKESYEAGDYKKAQVELQNSLRFAAPDEVREEALFLAASASFEAGDIWKAHHHVLAYWQAYPKGPHTSQLVELDYKIALRLLGGKWGRIYGVPLLPGGITGRSVLEKLLDRAPYHPLADDAQLALGDFYLRRENYPEAKLAYEALVIRYPQRETAEEARLMLAVATALDSQGIEYDTGVLQDAAGEFEYFTAIFPNADKRSVASTMFNRIVTALGRKDLQTGLYYLRTGHRDSAAHYLRSVETRYRGARLGDVAFELLGALESGQSNRHIMSLAKRLNRDLYKERERSEEYEHYLQRLGL